MGSQRLRLTKKIFLSLSSGQYIMSNTFPMVYEEIGVAPEAQWDNWSMLNGNTVDIFDSKKECLEIWWKLNSGSNLKPVDRVLFDGKLSKKVFDNQPQEYYILFTQEPFDYVELTRDREVIWQQIRQRNGYHIKIFKNKVDCLLAQSVMRSSLLDG